MLRQLWEQHLRFSGTTWFRGPEASALAALGRIDECRSVVAEALTEPPNGPERQGTMLVDVAGELRAHGHGGASRSMAAQALEWFDRTELPADFEATALEARINALTLFGRNREAYEFAEELPACDPDRWIFQGVLGIAAARLGDRAVAVTMSQRLADVDEPFTMGEPSYLRASIAAQLGDRKEAIRLLQQAVSRGFYRWGSIHVDTAFDPIRNDPEFQEVVGPKG